jgi:outer membrane protein TolC
LDQAIREAKANNPQFQRSKAQESEASWKIWEAASGHIPHLAITGSHAFDIKYQTINLNLGAAPVSIETIYPKTLLGIGASWTVFDGFQTWQQYRAARRGAEAASQELQRTEFSLEREVRMKFYQALGAQLLSAVAEQNVKSLEDHLARVKALLREGGGTKFDLLRVQVQYEEAVPEKAAADDNFVLARRALALALGQSEDARALTGSLPEPKADLVSEKLTWEAGQRDDLKALQNRADAADALHSASFSSWYPKVSLTAEKQYYNNEDYSLSRGYRDAYFIGATMSWNLFDGGASIARQKESLYQAQQAELASKAAQMKAPTEFETWKRRYRYNAALFEARKRAVDAAKESIRLAKLGVRAGTRTNTDLLDAELDYFRAGAGVVKAQLDSVEALINLELALGRRISGE